MLWIALPLLLWQNSILMECRKTYHYTQNLLLCLSLIIIGSYGLQAQKINLKGVVKDYVTGLPVENAIVVDSAEAVYSTTNALGENIV